MKKMGEENDEKCRKECRKGYREEEVKKGEDRGRGK
jgi:hypothetical protein